MGRADLGALRDPRGERLRRLRLTGQSRYDHHSTDPTRADSENDGLPDGWEIAYETNPWLNDTAADNDGDSRTTLQEFQLGSDPRDYFDAVVPVFIVEGDKQVGLKNTVLPIALVVEVHRPGAVAGTVGDVFVNAPVTFSNGGGGLFSTQAEGGFASTLSLRSDAAGRVRVYFQLPDVHGAFLRPQARATASAMVEFQERTYLQLNTPTFAPNGVERFFGSV